MAGDLLPPAIQELILDVSKWAEGAEEAVGYDDEMIAANERVAASIEAMTAAIDEAAAGAAAGAEAGVAGSAGAAESDAAAEAARAEALSQEDLAAAIGGTVDATGKLHTEQGRFITQADAVAAANERMAGMSDEAATAFMEQARAAQFAADTERLLADVDKQLAAGNVILADSAGAEAAGMKARAAAADAEAGSAKKMGSGWKVAGLAVAVGLFEAVKSAANFQTQITRLQTSAGELHKNLANVSAGILQMSGQTNTSVTELAKGMYYVESAGYHGAHGLEVLKAAAEGAQAEGADMIEVSDALTTSMVDYGAHSNQATQYMNMMIAAVAHGKTTLQAFASSLAQVLPTAAKAGLGFAQIGGAMATMTAQGMTARQASQDLRHAISSLENPTAVQTKEMGQLGVSSLDVQKNLGTRGLTGTLDMLSQAVLKNMKGGTVLLKSFNQSKIAAQSATTMIAAMPPSLQKLGKAYLDGSISASQWRKQVTSGNLPANMANLMKQFAGVADKAHGFNDALKAGQGDRQSFIAAMSKMTGGTVGAQVALMLGGKNAGIFAGNVALVGDAAKKTGKDVDNWKLIQSNFNFQLGSAEKSVEAVGISIGQRLLPALTTVVHALATGAQWLSKNAAAGKALAIVIGAVLAIAVERGLVKSLSAGGKALGHFGQDLGRLGKLFKGADGEAGTLSKAFSKIGDAGRGAWNMLRSAWSGLTGLFSKAKTATEAQTVAQDAQAVSADAAAASTEAEGVAMETTAAATEAEAAASEGATVAATELDVALDANPISLIILAIVALVIAFIALWDNCAAFRNFWKGMWRDIKAWAVDAWHGIDAAIHAIVHAFDNLKHAFDNFMHAMDNVGHAIGNFLHAMGNVGHAVGNVIHAFDNVEHAISNVINWIKGHWWILAAILLGPIAGAVAFIITHWSMLVSATKAAWNAIKAAAVAAWHFIDGNVFQPIGNAAVAVAHFFARMAADIGHAWANVKQWAADAWQFLSNIFSQIVNAAVNLGSRIIATFERWVSAVRGKLDEARSAVSNFGSEIVSMIEGLGGRLFSAGEHIIEMLAQGIRAAIGAVTSAIGSVMSAVSNFIPLSPAKKGPLSGAGDPIRGGREIMNRLATGIRGGQTLPSGAMAEALKKLGVGTAAGGGSQLSLSGAFTSPAGAGVGASAASQLHVTVDLSNATSSPQWQQGLQRAIQQAVLDYAVRNGGSGLLLPQRPGVR